MNVTRATALHAPVLAALHGGSFSKAWDADAFNALLSQPGVGAWIWEGDEPCGFILIRAAADEAEIITLAVSPAHRRRGIAAALVDTAATTLSRADVRHFFLEVAADNMAAVALYEAAGFSPCGRRAGYYQEAGIAKDAVIMKRAL